MASNSSKHSLSFQSSRLSRPQQIWMGVAARPQAQRQPVRLERWTKTAWNALNMRHSNQARPLEELACPRTAWLDQLWLSNKVTIVHRSSSQQSSRRTSNYKSHLKTASIWQALSRPSSFPRNQRQEWSHRQLPQHKPFTATVLTTWLQVAAIQPWTTLHSNSNQVTSVIWAMINSPQLNNKSNRAVATYLC